MSARLIVVAIALGTLVSGLAGVRSHYIGVGELRERGKWQLQASQDAEKAAQESAELTREARRFDAARQVEIERIADETATRETLLRDRITSAGREHRGLLDTIAALNERNAKLPGAGTDASVDALIGEAATARRLLGVCSERRQAVAAAAAGLVDQVTGLQAYAQLCQRTEANP